MENNEQHIHINRCPRCMRESAEIPCPHCGFDPAKRRQPGYALPPGIVIHGRYLTGMMLGQGGFGITYVGWDLALDIKVAIKEYYPMGQVSRNCTFSNSLVWSDTEQTGELRRKGMDSFLREARKMARLDDISGVVRVRDTFYENETAYIVMDFVEGETLKERLKRDGLMSFAEAMQIFRPAMLAMQQVHEAGVIHRDLSPDNLMIDSKGRTHILDLGAAKDLTVNQGASSILVAKGGFSPIEQYSQRGGSGPWTDVYAMAATIYYTLTGMLPPASVDRMNGEALRMDLPQLTALPARTRAVLEKALAVTVNDRIQSMDELLAGLEDSMKTEPPAVASAAPPERRSPAAQAMPEQKAPEPPPAAEAQSIMEPQSTAPEPEIAEAHSQPEPESPETQPEEENPEPQAMAQEPPPGQAKITKRWLLPAVCAAVLCLVAGVFALSSGKPNAKETGGACGDAVTWTLFDDGTLTISGSGPMENFNRLDHPAPWSGSGDAILRINVQDGVTAIGNDAFYECTRLSTAELADSVTGIGSRAFYGCASLGSVALPAGVRVIGESGFGGCSALTSLEIPAGVRETDSGAFAGCTGLRSVTIAEGVTVIGASEFSDCSALTSVAIPNSVSVIGDYAFRGCAGLTSVDIPDGVTMIGLYAFGSCEKLASVTIPAGVKEIRAYAFDGCAALADVYFGGGSEQWEALRSRAPNGNDPLFSANIHYGT